MELPLTILFAAGGLFLLYLLIWRVLSTFITLPCPPGYIFLLDSPLINRVAGPEILIQRAGIEPGQRVLDAGCGPGRVTIPIAKHLAETGQVIALDMQSGMLNRLQKRVSANDLYNVEVIQGELGKGLLENHTFDRAIMISVLGEIPDQLAALEEIYQSLMPGGILSITEILPDPHFQSKKKVTNLAERTGFNIDESFSGWRAFTVNLIKPIP